MSRASLHLCLFYSSISRYKLMGADAIVNFFDTLSLSPCAFSLGKCIAAFQPCRQMSTFELDFDDDQDPPATPAATLVIFRNNPGGTAPQLLMIQRANTMAFASGAAVFPGGRVDDADRELATQLARQDSETLDELAARIAALRETLEETGLALGLTHQPSLAEAHRARQIVLESKQLAPALAELGWQLDLDALIPFARWLPKHRNMRVYDTRFYLADLGTGAVDLMVDASETTHLFWASAAEALAMADRDEIKIIYPTRRNLERLALFGSYADAAEHARQIPPPVVTPFVEQRGAETWLMIRDDAGYPVLGEPLTSASRG